MEVYGRTIAVDPLQWRASRAQRNEGAKRMLDESAAITILFGVYIAVCFGKIAHKHGKNPWLYGVLAVIVPVNLMILGYWAFSGAGEPVRKP